MSSWWPFGKKKAAPAAAELQEEPREDSPQAMYKIVITGPQRVGKSSLKLRFTQDVFSPEYMPTIGVEFDVKQVPDERRKDGRIKLQIWDTAGQERFRSIVRSYGRGSHVRLFVFDITSAQSFEDMKLLLQDCLRDLQDSPASDRVHLAVIGNKMDLEDDRQVAWETAQSWCDEQGVVYAEASAKDNIHVDGTFLHSILPDAYEGWGVLMPPK